jgi:hypothetical protein
MRDPDWEPSTHKNSIVSFWSKPIRARLEQSTLSPGQAAKRDLCRYHALLADHLPELYPENAQELVRLAYTLDHPPGLAAWHPAERLALLDAADRCIAEMDRDPSLNLADVVARHFRLTPEGI